MVQKLAFAAVLTAGLLAVSLAPARAASEAAAPPAQQEKAAPARAAIEAAAPPAQKEKAAPAEEKPAGAHEGTRKEAEKFAQLAGEKVKTFAEHADGYLDKATSSPGYGWTALAVATLVGTLSLFFGWTFLQWLLVPAAPVLGLATGGFTAFCIIQALYTNRPVWFRLTLLAVGIGLGVGLYLFSALKAKPVAAFLVILSPFLMLAAFLFSYSSAIGLIIFCIGFVAGFAAMIEVRPLSIVATSFMGAGALIATWGLLSHLLGGQPPFVRDVFKWLIDNPLMLAIAWGALAFVGVCFQFATGPRGSLQD